jgi:hypothetical protein
MAFDDLRVGLEYEFIAILNLENIPDDVARYHRVREFSAYELSKFYLGLDETDDYDDYDSRLSALTQFDSYRAGKRFMEINQKSALRQNSPGRYMALAGVPKWVRFYRYRNGEYLDRTDETRALLANNTDLEFVAKKLNSLYMKIPVNMKENSKAYHEFGDYTINHVADKFEAVIGQNIARAINAPRRRRIAWDAAKKRPGWYMKEESLDLDGLNWNTANGLELVTPPCHPLISQVYSKMILRALEQPTEEFSFLTQQDCGIHVNISHRSYTRDDYSPCYIGLMFDDLSFMKAFGRYDEHNKDNRSHIEHVIKRLCAYEFICLDDLNTDKGFRFVCDMVDANAKHHVNRSIEYEKVNNYCYLEHRSGGGKDYEKNPDGLIDYIQALCEFTLTYPSRWENLAFRDRLREVMIQAGAKQTVSSMARAWIRP